MNQFASALSRTAPYDSNASAASGSLLVHNKAVEFKRRPLDTGAGNGEKDILLMLGQLAASDNIPLHWRGYQQGSPNRATAKETERPWLEAMQRYQSFWRDVYSDLVETVLGAAVKYGGKNIQTFEAEISFASPFMMDANEMASMVDSITNAAVNGTVDFAMAKRANEAIMTIALSSFGVDDPLNVIEPDTANETPAVEYNNGIDIVSTAYESYQSGKISKDEMVEYLVTQLAA